MGIRCVGILVILTCMGACGDTKNQSVPPTHNVEPVNDATTPDTSEDDAKAQETVDQSASVVAFLSLFQYFKHSLSGYKHQNTSPKFPEPRVYMECPLVLLIAVFYGFFRGFVVTKAAAITVNT